MAKELYVIAGPNGAGKTTFAREFLPYFAKCEEFVNADFIATGLSPFSPRDAALQAGRLMLQRIHDLAAQRKSFGFETTLAGKSYTRLFQYLKLHHYSIHLIFLWLPKVDLAIKRVQDRVRQGGHSVPEADIRRRFKRGIHNLFSVYRPLIDTWTLLDNSGPKPKRVASGTPAEIQIADPSIFSYIKTGQ